MKHFIFFYHGLALFIGISAITISIFAQIKYKNTFFKVYILFLTALAALVLEQSFTAYGLINEVDNLWIINIVKYISWLSSISLTYITPLMFHQLVDKEAWKKRKRYFLSLTGFSFIMFIVYIVYRSKLPMTLSNIIMFSSILYSISIVVRNRNNIKNADINNVLKVITVISILFFPIMFLDTKTEGIAFFAEYFPYGLLSVPSFYLVWNLITLYWVSRYISQKNIFENETEVLSPEEKLDKLCEKYSITKREREVVQLLVNGYSYNDISEALNISLSTVKTHIRNIYGKTEVNNKIELINLLSE